MISSSTICAIATAPGGAIGIVRVSGTAAIDMVDRVFRPHQGAPLAHRKSHSLTYGNIVAPSGTTLDDVLVGIFRAPHSYTGENAAEISCHGSPYILQTLLELLCAEGCQLAAPGEFTQRAFLNGKMDLSQAEAVADVIAATTAAGHRIAMSQMRGDFSKELMLLRERLLHLTSLLELELDFSDHEDLEFADRTQLTQLATEIHQTTQRLADSFATGNALKNGIPVAIVGSTNSGKSTLLNALLHDERAIVSDVHGTTRDVIEDTYNIGGMLFRFIDTAGLRSTTDTIEQLGIQRSRKKLAEAQIVLFLVDATHAEEQLAALANDIRNESYGKTLIVAYNKCDLISIDLDSLTRRFFPPAPQGPSPLSIVISAKEHLHLDRLTDLLLLSANQQATSGGDIIISNVRHLTALTAALDDIQRVLTALSLHLSGDLIAQDLRACIFHLSEITGGAITSDEILGTIFQHFCIGK